MKIILPRKESVVRTCIAHGLLITLTLILSHCATVATPPTAVEAPVSRSQQREAQQRTSIPETKILKRKVAIARFSNETRYGKTFWLYRIWCGGMIQICGDGNQCAVLLSLHDRT